MKKKLPRIVACLMACIIAFNGIAIPKAKAAVLPTAALTAACLSVYLMGTGFSFGSNNWDVDSGNKLIADTLVSKYDEFSAYIKSSPEELRSRLASGTEILTNGVVKFNSSVCALLAEFSDWLIDTFQLVPGADPTPVYSSTTDGFNCFVNGEPLFFEFTEIHYTGGDPYLTLGTNLNSESSGFAGHHIYLQNDAVYQRYIDNTGIQELNWVDSSSNTILHQIILRTDYVWANYIIRDEMYDKWIFTRAEKDSDDYWRLKNPRYLTFEEYPWLDEFFGIEVADVSVGLTAGYESAPDVEEQYVMALDTGLTYANEQGFIDSVLSGTASGTLAPTYEIEEETSSDDDIIIPDSGADVDSGILNWVKDIAQSVKALPQSIADAFTSLFAVDQALVSEISDTFTAKFGFVSTLHNLGTDLLFIDASSAPPVVYIHLEDAEGSIYYGETCKALDMSWYARYKEDGDRIMSGFLWIGFLWLLFKRASAIINGAEMATDYGTDIHDGFRIRGERNGKRF